MRTLALCLVIGCGGAVSGPVEREDAGDATAPKDVTPPPPPPPGDATTFDCKALLAKIDVRREELKVCCPFCGALQCTHVTQDLCCPFSTTATVTTDFDMMVAQYKQNCPSMCPGAPCMMVPSGKCTPTTNNMGRCQ